MSRKFAVAVVAGLVAVVLGVADASAQGVVRFTTDFAFMVGQKELPAGTYTLRTTGDNLQFETIEGAANQVSADVPVQTRLGEDPVPQTNIVFDVAGGKYYLSEIQVPHQDGYLVGWAPGPHTHRVVKTSHAK